MQTHIRATEFEAAASGDGLTIEGYASVFRSEALVTDHLGTYFEQFLPGSFKRSLQQRGPSKVRMMWNHGKDTLGQTPIGVWEDLSEDSHGLHVRGRIMDTARTADVRAGIEMGAITGMSIRFLVPENGEQWDKRSRPHHRSLSEVGLLEAGPVAWEQYEDTEVSLRGTFVDLWRATLTGDVAPVPVDGTRDEDNQTVAEAGRPAAITLSEMRKRALVLRGVIVNDSAGVAS